MNLSSVGPWIAVTAALPALVIVVVSLFALRGADPKERPEILRALADLFHATRRARRLPRRQRDAEDP
jgi:hypothetical protein